MLLLPRQQIELCHFFSPPIFNDIMIIFRFHSQMNSKHEGKKGNKNTVRIFHYYWQIKRETLPTFSFYSLSLLSLCFCSVVSTFFFSWDSIIWKIEQNSITSVDIQGHTANSFLVSLLKSSQHLWCCDYVCIVFGAQYTQVPQTKQT